MFNMNDRFNLCIWEICVHISECIKSVQLKHIRSIYRLIRQIALWKEWKISWLGLSRKKVWQLPSRKYPCYNSSNLHQVGKCYRNKSWRIKRFFKWEQSTRRLFVENWNSNPKSLLCMSLLYTSWRISILW